MDLDKKYPTEEVEEVSSKNEQPEPQQVVNEVVEDFSHFAKPEDVDLEAYNKELEKKLLEPETNFVTLDIIKDYTSEEIAEAVKKLVGKNEKQEFKFNNAYGPLRIDHGKRCFHK